MKDLSRALGKKNTLPQCSWLDFSLARTGQS
jgi:hypothetical protein